MKRLANANARGRARGRGHRGRRAALGMNHLRKQGIAEKAIVYRRWPVYLPGTMARSLLHGGHQDLLTLARIIAASCACAVANLRPSHACQAL